PALTIDGATPAPPAYRFSIPGTYTIRTVERGEEYEPVLHTQTVTVAAGSPGVLRAESLEVTGNPPPFHNNFFRGVGLSPSGIALSTGPGGDLFVLIYRGQTNPEDTTDVETGYYLQLGDPESDRWTDPVRLSEDPADLTIVPTDASEKLLDTSASVLQSYGLAVTGRQVHLTWIDNTKSLVYRSGLITAASPNDFSLAWDARTVLETNVSDRVVPVADPTDPTHCTLVITSGSINSSESLVLYDITAPGTTALRSSVDITRSSSDGSRIVAHDAVRLGDGRLMVAALENGGPFDPGIDCTASVIGAGSSLDASYTVGSGVDTSFPPALLADGDSEAILAFIQGTTGVVRRLTATGIGVGNFPIPPVTDLVAGSVDLDRDPNGQLAVLVQDTSGSIFDVIVGHIRVLHLTPDTLESIDEQPVSPSPYDTSDNGVGLLVPSSVALHVFWQEKGLNLNRNSRVLENRTN
ncbi:MAG: hypothetical protein ABI743_14875, partial [bacterium]